MGFIGTLLLVIFVITSLLLILMVLVQSEDGDSLGGLFAGGSSSAFGSRSGNVMTKTTYILGAIFLTVSLALAWVNRSEGVQAIESAQTTKQAPASGDWIKGQPEAPAAIPAPATTPVPVSETPASGTPATPVPAPVAPATPAAPAAK